jgi:hypothetical protein
LLKLDHLTVIAPTLSEAVSHVRDCLGLDVPFGSRHDYMGTHNHRLQLGNSVYLEIVALDPDGNDPAGGPFRCKHEAIGEGGLSDAVGPLRHELRRHQQRKVMLGKQ